MLKIRVDDVMWKQVDDEIVVLDLRASRYLQVNDSGAFLWPLLVDGREHADLVKALTEAFSIEQTQASSDLDAFLAALTERDLLAREP